MIRRYRKKPVVIEAVKFTGTSGNWQEVTTFTKGKASHLNIERNGKTTCIVETLEGFHVADKGDYIIKGVKGEFYPCKPDIFAMTYEEDTDG